jgi:hypothetical protein
VAVSEISGVITDFDGKFSLNVLITKAVLSISYRYTTFEVAVGNNSQLKITFFADAQALQEVVVNVLGIKGKRDNLASTYLLLMQRALNSKEPTL